MREPVRSISNACKWQRNDLKLIRGGSYIEGRRMGLRRTYEGEGDDGFEASHCGRVGRVRLWIGAGREDRAVVER